MLEDVCLPVLLPLSEGRVPADDPLVPLLQCRQHSPPLATYFRPDFGSSVKSSSYRNYSTYQSNNQLFNNFYWNFESNPLEIYPPNKLSNQTELFSSSSFNFLYKIYYKTGVEENIIIFLVICRYNQLT